RPQRGGERRGGGTTPDAGPADRDRDLVRIRPFEDQGLDAAGHRGYRVEQQWRFKGAGDPFMLQQIALRRDALGDINRQDQRQRSRPDRAGDRQQQKEGADRSESTMPRSSAVAASAPTSRVSRIGHNGANPDLAGDGAAAFRAP